MAPASEFVMLAFATLARERRPVNEQLPEMTLIAKLAGAVVHSGDPAHAMWLAQ